MAYDTTEARILVKSSAWFPLLLRLQKWLCCTALQQPVCSGPHLSHAAGLFLQLELHVAQAIAGPWLETHRVCCCACEHRSHRMTYILACAIATVGVCDCRFHANSVQNKNNKRRRKKMSGFV